MQQLSDVITQKLLFEIRDGALAGQDALPPEVDLAERFNVSRNIVRECLTRLEREGWVTRKHGVGTLINKQVVHLKNRLDQTCGLQQALELNGKKVEIEIRELKVIPAMGEVAANLEIHEGTPVLRISQLFRADGKPAIYCIDHIPERLILNRQYSKKDMLPTIFHFLKNFCGDTIETFLTEVRVLPASEEVSEALEVPRACGLLFLGETGYNLRSKPIIYTDEYYIDRVIHHMIIRKMI
jgi:GntR family transcriptional regulator